jgi:hypothetical protein
LELQRSTNGGQGRAGLLQHTAVGVVAAAVVAVVAAAYVLY